ncbi:MAG: NUDIX domain-containing protein [Sphaerochaetaceae bacterium]|nr:NUDIX domain-containing protein [Sphaerochaetaceae bacterium]
MKVKSEKSCGAVIYTKDNDKIKYLLVLEPNGVWGFPKGHVEKNETEVETALREIREETGLHVELNTEFKEVENYSFQMKDSPRINKQVIYFLGEYSDQIPVVARPEISDIKTAELKTALRTLHFANKKEILKKADAFIKQQSNNI